MTFNDMQGHSQTADAHNGVGTGMATRFWRRVCAPAGGHAWHVLRCLQHCGERSEPDSAGTSEASLTGCVHQTVRCLTSEASLIGTPF